MKLIDKIEPIRFFLSGLLFISIFYYIYRGPQISINKLLLLLILVTLAIFIISDILFYSFILKGQEISSEKLFLLLGSILPVIIEWWAFPRYSNTFFAYSSANIFFLIPLFVNVKKGINIGEEISRTHSTLLPLSLISFSAMSLLWNRYLLFAIILCILFVIIYIFIKISDNIKFIFAIIFVSPMIFASFYEYSLFSLFVGSVISIIMGIVYEILNSWFKILDTNDEFHDTAITIGGSTIGLSMISMKSIWKLPYWIPSNTETTELQNFSLNIPPNFRLLIGLVIYFLFFLMFLTAFSDFLKKYLFEILEEKEKKNQIDEFSHLHELFLSTLRSAKRTILKNGVILSIIVGYILGGVSLIYLLTKTSPFYLFIKGEKFIRLPTSRLPLIGLIMPIFAFLLSIGVTIKWGERNELNEELEDMEI